MTRTLAVVLLLVACGDDAGTGLPINPGGGGPGGNTNPDAAIGDDSGAGSTITGRVCVITDVRVVADCAVTTAGGITVQLGTASATTTSDGSFTITHPGGTNLVWRVSGAAIESSAKLLAHGTTIPAVESLTYGDMLAITNATVVGGSGAIIAYVSYNGTPAVAVVASPSPQSDSGEYYDGPSTLEWAVDETNGSGVIWIPSIAAGTASLALDNGTNQTTLTGIDVFADTITFVTGTAPAP